MNIITILDIRKRIAITKENISCSIIQDVSTPTCVIISCKQDCGVGRLFRIPTPTPDSDSNSFEKPTPTPAVLKNRLRLPTPAFLKTRLRLPTPAENMRLHRLPTPTPQP